MGWSATDRRRARAELGRLAAVVVQAFQDGDADAALQAQQESAELLREQAATGDADALGALATHLYNTASLFVSMDRADDAVAVLDESEQTWLRMRGSGKPDQTAKRIADIQSRRGWARSVGGAGASAVVDVQSAVAGYSALGADNDVRARRRVPATDFARVLASGCDVLAVFADPDQAVLAAGGAIVRYSGNPLSLIGGERVQRAANRALYHRAAEVAAIVHAAQGDEEMAEAARAIRKTKPQLQVSTVLQQRQASPRPVALNNTLSAALNAATASGADREVVSVLRKALVHEPEWREAVRRGPFTPLGRVMTGADRAGLKTAATHALALAGLAHQVLPGAPQAGMRLGLEAHYLLAGAARLQAASVQDQSGEIGAAWARVLLACCRQATSAGDAALALDLAGWAADTARQLAGPGRTQQSLRPLLGECLRTHGQLLADAGDSQGAEHALRAAAALDLPA